METVEATTPGAAPQSAASILYDHPDNQAETVSVVKPPPATPPATPAAPAASNSAAKTLYDHPDNVAAPPATPPTPPASPSAIPAAPAAPGDIVLELPEGSLLDAAVVERATTFAKEHGLAPKEAQKALEFIDAEVAGAPERLREAFVEEAENHPVIGGANYEQTLRDASAGRAAMIEFGDWNDDTVAFLNNTGLGNHVAAIQLVARTGKLVQENRVLRQELQRLRHR